MDKKNLYYTLVLLLLFIIAAFIGWLRRESAVADNVYVVQDECVWAWPLANGDTVFQSLDGRRFSYVADSVASTYYGTAKRNILGIVSVPSFFLPSAYKSIPSDSLEVLRDSVHTLDSILRYESEEMEYYRDTHSPSSSGYQTVMEIGTELSRRVNAMDSLLSIWPEKMKVRPLLWHRRTFWKYSQEENKLVSVNFGYGIQSRHNWLLRMGIDMGWRVFNDGIYCGGRDSLGKPHGYGVYRNAHSMYSGQWEHGVRSGNGVGVEPWRIIMSGSWSNDRFQGEKSYYDSSSVFGIDISRYQHEFKQTVTVRLRRRHGRSRYAKRVKTVKYPIRWQKLSISSLGANNDANVSGRIKFPVSFIYIKATQGTSISSKYCTQDAAAARRRGIPVGAYHFFSTRGGVAQARYFLSVAKPHKGDLPPVLDVELTDREIARMGGAAIMCREMRAWLEVVKQHCGTAPVLYVSQKFVDRYLSSPESSLRDYPVWIARYSSFRPYVRLTFWQLSPYGRVDGIHGSADIDVFNGSRGQFEQWCREHACH